MMNRKNAFVTFVMRNDSYVPGALVVAYCLLKQHIDADLVCMVTSDVSQQSIQGLSSVYHHVVVVDEIRIDYTNTQDRQDRPFLFTRFQALRLGQDGDLGFSYEKIIVLDCDILPMERYQDLLEISAPAGIINEQPRFWTNHSDKKTDSQMGRMEWHDVYEPICPHGHLIPKQITDRVWSDVSNLGVNACLWILSPNMKDYDSIMEQLENADVLDKVQSFHWPEMQFATYYWSGQWTNVDLRYCALKSIPGLECIYGTHFAGIKPWNERKKKMLKHYYRFQDYQLWYQEFCSMAMKEYPQMQSIPKVRRLVSFCRDELHIYM